MSHTHLLVDPDDGQVVYVWTKGQEEVIPEVRNEAGKRLERDLETVLIFKGHLNPIHDDGAEFLDLSGEF